MSAVLRHVSVETARIPDEFFPAHLSVALIDAVFGFLPEVDEPSSAIAGRYCRYFGLERTRADRWQPPPVHDQETLREFIGHYDDLGVFGMAAEVFRTTDPVPGTNVARAEYGLRLATELRRVGVDVLQDLGTWRRKNIDAVFRTLAGADERILRMLLNYAGDDDFAWGDASVRRFVASAIGRERVSASRAANLVRRAAYELVLSPRYLDHQIRMYCDGLREQTSPIRGPAPVRHGAGRRLDSPSNAGTL